jgi:hypothetical protein
VDVLLAQAILVPVFDKAPARIDDENALPSRGAFLVDNHDAGGNARAVEEVRRQADDAFDVASAHEVAPDIRFGIASKEHAVRKDARAGAGALERADDMQQVGVVALFGRRRTKMLEPIEPIVLRVEAGAPPLVAEGRICDDVIEGVEGVAIPELRIGKRIPLTEEYLSQLFACGDRPFSPEDVKTIEVGVKKLFQQRGDMVGSGVKTLIFDALRDECSYAKTLLMRGVASTPNNLIAMIKAYSKREFTFDEIANALEELSEAGMVIRCGEGRYTVPDWEEQIASAFE